MRRCWVEGRETNSSRVGGIKKYVDEDKQMVSSGALGAAGSADLGLDSTSRAVIAQHRREMRDRIKDDAAALIAMEQSAVLDDSFGVSDATTQNLKGKITFSGQDITDSNHDSSIRTRTATSPRRSCRPVWTWPKRHPRNRVFVTTRLY